jgi:hypothetical protein
LVEKEVKAMMILLIIQLSGYWLQTDWSGPDGQYTWQDTSGYFLSETLDGRIIPGELRLCSPSTKWKGFSLPWPAKQVNTIIEADDGEIYVGCGWDSASVMKLTNYGSTYVCRSSFGAGEVVSLLALQDGNILAGTKGGNIYLGKDTVWAEVASFGIEITALYQPPDFDWIYLGTSDGKIWISKTGGTSWNFYAYPCPLSPQTEKVLAIFQSLAGKFYACTKSTTGGQVFRSLDDGLHWDSLYGFPGVEGIHSICEGLDGELYVSTGYPGKIFVGSDTGGVWQEIDPPCSPACFYNLLSDRNGTLFIGGKCTAKAPKGMIFKSSDKGQTWDTLFRSQGRHPYEIFALMQTRSGLMLAGGDTAAFFRSGYSQSGWLESSIYDVFDGETVVNSSLEFGRLHFKSYDGVVGIKIRSSDILDSMPAWGAFVPNDSNPVDYGAARHGDRYIQYMAEIISESPNTTPVLEELFIKYKTDVGNPTVVSAVASDGEWPDTCIDVDDYVAIWFDEPTKMPRIETSNIDEVLRLSGGHSWRSDSGRGVIKMPGEWVSPSMLKIHLSTLRLGGGEGYPPTVSIGDTIYPDSMTIRDQWDNACSSPRVITGGFGISEGDGNMAVARLLPATPNPFRSQTVIRYQLDCRTGVVLALYDVSGRLVKTLVHEEKAPGSHSVESGPIESGVHFVRLKTGNTVFTQKLIRLN